MRHIYGFDQRFAEELEALSVFAGLGDLIEALLGGLDEIARGQVDGRVIGGVDDVRTDIDELAALRQFIDGLDMWKVFLENLCGKLSITQKRNQIPL